MYIKSPFAENNKYSLPKKDIKKIKSEVQKIKSNKETKKPGTKANNVSKPKPKVEPCPGKVDPVTSVLDGIQKFLDIVGFIPGIGDIADGVNAIISFLRANYLDAIISVGCIVFSIFGDTILKPLKRATGKLVEKIKVIADKIPGFLSGANSFIQGISNFVQKIWFIGKKMKNSIKEGCDKFVEGLTSLFRQADDYAFAGIPNGMIDEAESNVDKVIIKGAGGAKNSVDDILESSTPGRVTKGKTTQYEKTGGYQKALEDFDSLDVKNIRDLPNGKGKVGELSDGRTVNVRNVSSEGSPTIEIQDGKIKIKIRYK